MKKALLIFLLSFLYNSRLYAQLFSFSFEGISRSYILHLPAGYNSANKYPVVLNFHGHGSNATEQLFYSGMNATADKYKFIVVYPEGVDGAWNAGVGLNPEINDAGFVNALLDTLIKNYSVNTEKVYSCGMSLGGFLTYYLGCNLSERFTAIASVTGVVGSAVASACRPAKALPLLHIHGTSDNVVNYNGFTGVLGAEASVMKWVDIDGCTLAADTTHLPDINTTDQSTVDLIKYSNCQNNLEVWFYKVYNGGHTWPGGLNLPNKITNQDFSASEEIWKFFDRFPAVVTALEDKTESKSIKIFPNPVQDLLILSEEITGKVIVSDMTGHVAAEFYINGKVANIGGLAEGLYILQIRESGRSVIRTRFVRE